MYKKGSLDHTKRVFQHHRQFHCWEENVPGSCFLLQILDFFSSEVKLTNVSPSK